jgi:hypothetical protein
MNPIINKELKDKILKTFEEGKMRDDWNYEIIKADWDGFVKKLNNVIDETTKQAEKRFIEIIDKMLAEGLNGRRYNFMINGEKLKQKLTNHTPKETIKSIGNEKWIGIYYLL